MATLQVAEVIVRPAGEVAETGAAWIAERLLRAVAERGQASLGLSGGTTPAPLYRALAARPAIDWARVLIAFVDERCVPPASPQSNYHLARGALLDAVPAARVVRIEGERDDPAAAAADYATRIPDVFDVLVMGIGDDGHTASLFPGGPWDRPAGVKAMATRSPAAAPHQRISLSPEVIEAARARLVMVTGEKKQEIVRLALEGEPDILHHPMFILSRSTWLLDEGAAARLKEGPHE